MLKEFLWNTFINTGDLEAYTFYKELYEEPQNEKKNVQKYVEEFAAMNAAISSEHK